MVVATKAADSKGTVKVRLSNTLESYLEEVYSLQKKFGAVRVTDLAERMGCKLPTATSAVRRLAALGLINYETYRPVTLTEAGEASVRELTSRHKILADVLQNLLAFSGPVAEKEACELEHLVAPRILRRLRLFMSFLRTLPPSTISLKEQTRKFATFVRSRAKKAQSGSAA